MTEQSDELTRSLFRKVAGTDSFEADYLSNLWETIAAKHETSRLGILRWYAGYSRRHGYMDDDHFQQVLEWIIVQETIEAMEFELTVLKGSKELIEEFLKEKD